MNWKKITEPFPALAVFLIICGYIHLFYYYLHWDVDITSYLTLTEITLLFFKPAIFICFLAITYFMAAIPAIMLYRRNARNIKKDDKIEDGTRERKFPGWATILMIIVFLGVFAGYPLYSGWCDYDIGNSVIGHVTLIIAVAGGLNWLKKNFALDKQKNESGTATQVVLAIAIVILSATIFQAHFEIHRIETKPIQYTIEFEDQTLKTDSSRIFIGKTEGYLFLYDLKDSLAHIYPMTEIRSITKGRHVVKKP